MFTLYFSEIIMRDQLSCPRYWDARSSPPVYIRLTPANQDAGTAQAGDEGPMRRQCWRWLHLTSSHLFNKNYLGTVLVSPGPTGLAGLNILSWSESVSQWDHDSLPTSDLTGRSLAWRRQWYLLQYLVGLLSTGDLSKLVQTLYSLGLQSRSTVYSLHTRLHCATVDHL